jgi:hypothetical protein
MRKAGWLQGAFGLLALSGLVAACEDPPPPTQEGAFFVQFTDSGIDCNVANHQQKLGTVGATDKPELVADGASNTDVVCTVQQAGDNFIVTADLDSAATLQIDIDSISEAQNTQATGAVGQIKYASSETGGNPYSATDCVFWVDTEAGQYLTPGGAWISFDCGAVTSGMESCSVSGYFALKNCTGVPTEDDE